MKGPSKQLLGWTLQKNNYIDTEVLSFYKKSKGFASRDAL